MWHGWKMATFQKTFYIVNWQWGKDQRPQQHFKDVCKWDLQALGINTDCWEVTATDRDAWRHIVKVGLSQYEETQRVKAEEERIRKKTVCLASRPTTAFTCSKCDRNCHSRIGLHSHKTDAAKWVQMYGLLRPTDANDELFIEYSCLLSSLKLSLRPGNFKK